MPETLLLRREPNVPISVDDAARTVRVTWSTGSAVMRRDMSGPYMEVLSLKPGHVKLDRLKGASVLDAHRQDDIRRVLGVVIDAGVTDGEGWADIKISTRDDVEPLWRDIRDGIIRHVSIGYSVDKWEDKTDARGQRTRTAVDWTVHEISFVPLPADAGAHTRSRAMPEAIETQDPQAQETRAQVNGEIRTLTRAAGLPSNFADDLIDRNATVDDARAAAFDELIKRGSPSVRTESVATVGNDYSDPQVRAEWLGEALYTRIDPTHKPSDQARQYVGLTLPEMGREILRLRGISTTAMSPSSVITRALHTTSDFSIILGDTVGRTLRQAYNAAPGGVRQLARQTTARDFRAKHRIMLGEAPTLEKVLEHGEFKHDTMEEAEESYKLDTFGKIFGITRQALINDDLGAFTDLSRRLGISAAEFERQHLVDLLTSGSGNGPTMNDTNPLFHTAHANKASSGAALSETTLSAARLAMRTQKGLSGKPIDVSPAFLLVPAALETTAEKTLAAIAAAKTSDANPFAGQLTLVVDARLDVTSGTRWYVVADPATIDGLEYSYLDGAPGPQIESKNGFEIDGVQLKVRLDFGAGFVDWRSWYMNAGA